VPLLFFGVISGVLADRFDRRVLALVTQVVNFSVTVGRSLLVKATLLDGVAHNVTRILGPLAGGSFTAVLGVEQC
jgi:hypothetical protein